MSVERLARKAYSPAGIFRRAMWGRLRRWTRGRCRSKHSRVRLAEWTSPTARQWRRSIRAERHAFACIFSTAHHIRRSVSID